ncbi:MAG TPA: GNAT family N-acetyltransferase [Gammaproteobacteria bacterium]
MEPTPSLTIRRGTPDDAKPLAELAVTTFADAFGHLYVPEDLARFLATKLTPLTYLRLLRDADCGVWIAQDDAGPFVGFATAGPCQLPVEAVEPRAGEVRQLYVRRAAQSAGLGTRLLVHALEWLEAQGRRPVYVGVWSGNHGAQRLYGRHGFEKVGEYGFRVGATVDREFILRRA